MAATGGQSFVMRKLYTLLPSLLEIKKLVIFDIQPPLCNDPRIEYYELDLTLPESRREMARILKDEHVDVFLHAAFLWNPVRDRVWAHEIESVGTEYTISACIEAKIKKIILTSSTLLYGARHNNPLKIKEEHPLNTEEFPNLKDKAGAERTVRKFAEKHPDIVITVLRSAMVMGPSVDSYLGRILSRPVVPVLLGYDPMVQLLHEDDFIQAYIQALRGDYPGIFNIVPTDHLPLSIVLKIGGRRGLPLPNLISKRLFQGLYASDLTDFPPSFLNYLRFPVLADGSKAEKKLKYLAKFSTAETARAFYDAAEKRSTNAV